VLHPSLHDDALPVRQGLIATRDDRTMRSRIAIALAAAAALTGGVIFAAAPSQAQDFSGNAFNGIAMTVQYSGHGGWGAPPRAYGPPRHYGRPGWGYGPPPRRCWNRPVDVWNGWGYERRWQRVCR
jgi:hypothetical protein